MVPLLDTGSGFAVDIAQLPEAERLAYLQRESENLHLDPGVFDDVAHEAFMQAPPSRRERAERKAEIARFLVSLGDAIVWREREKLVHKRFGAKGNSAQRLKAIVKRVQGVDPINFAPALLDNYTCGAKGRADMSTDAWRFFMTVIRNAAPEFPLSAAWRDTRDVGKKMGWAVPSYPTFYRRWNALSVAERHTARHGREATVKRLTIPTVRDKTSIAPLEWVSLDGRTQDFWVDFGDGRAVRPVMIAVADVASNMVLGWELVETENAPATVRVIKRICETFGIFDRLYPDNGSAFAGHLVAGGNVHRFRNGGKKPEGVQPPGICKIMGINLTFALPKNAQAKIMERVFASLSRVVDDRPEFRGCHAGHAPGASPSADVVPIPVEDARKVIEREIARFNREPGRRGQGANGRSYEQVFQDGLDARIKRKPTAKQIYLAGLIYSPVSVDRFGQVRKYGWTYGDPLSQEALLPFHKSGRKILLGRDPDDFSAPAIAFDEDGNLICEGIAPVQAGKYDSVDGIRSAKRNKKAARAAATAAEKAHDYMTDQEFVAALAALDAPTPAPMPSQPEQVVAGRFGSPLKAKPKPEGETGQTINPDFYRNMDTALEAKKARAGKLA
ncbi:DDE-type integrase/transposase/recombinase [Roseobacter sp. HKCCD9010]|uniref:transposase domain-containing protein n=1 Tax=unclassified Roseobacter TaxID=196798 RepID=UPI0014920D22|nr:MULTISPECIES: transposase domain-containing protein [unclassified Roseobacter]MBF9050528.1 DDE-type integrase/transposase/recombinase [Rhodobacterales bacterium HKCCD4356]NNW07196.1 DDE-type integrase/transposase/recombinase [Roseobacter sp. HKCCD8431]NNV12055.1 DDE-type integrase/transposase/recombinase [Roseobacter sp. HKCCD7357]NNV17069.1 DDE-type integrase/transposase/recombinase [Roseobacter sp. HKCCD8768]NNV26298.1 DDE-type integrase/transposase/recombinase [Roseobacter sp. HKCCD8192]